MDNDYIRFVKEYFKLFTPEILNEFSPSDSDTYEIKKNRAKTQAALNHSKQSICEILDNDELIWTPSESSFNICKLAVLYMADLLLKSKDVVSFKDWCVLILPHIKQNSLFALWIIKYLTKHKSIVFSMLLECQSTEIREAFKNTIVEGMKIITRIEEGYINEVEKFINNYQNMYSKTEFIVSRAASIRFMNLLITDGLSYARTNYTRFDDYFAVMISFTSLGQSVIESMISMNSVYSIIDFVSNTPNSLKSTNSKACRPVMNEGIKETNFNQPVKLLSILIRNCVTQQMKDKLTFPPCSLINQSIGVPEVPESEIAFLFSTKWNCFNLLSNCKEDLLAIFIHLTWENEKRINEIITSLTKHVYDNKLKFDLLTTLIIVEDSYLRQRYLAFSHCEITANKSIYEILENSQENIIMDLAEFMSELIKSKILLNLIKEDKEKWNWIISWLENKNRVLKDESEDITQKRIGSLMTKFSPLIFVEILPESEMAQKNHD